MLSTHIFVHTHTHTNTLLDYSRKMEICPLPLCHPQSPAHCTFTGLGHWAGSSLSTQSLGAALSFPHSPEVPKPHPPDPQPSLPHLPSVHGSRPSSGLILPPWTPASVYPPYRPRVFLHPELPLPLSAHSPPGAPHTLGESPWYARLRVPLALSP